jgi:hypothetical protein
MFSTGTKTRNTVTSAKIGGDQAGDDVFDKKRPRKGGF